MTAERPGRRRAPNGARRRYAEGEKWLHGEVQTWLADLERALPGRLLAYHTLRSDGSSPGFPDWIFCGPGGLLPVEEKGPTEKLRPDQATWFEMLRRARVLHPPELWRPDDYSRGYVGAKLRYIAGLGIAERDRLGSGPCPRCGQPPGQCLPDREISDG